MKKAGQLLAVLTAASVLLSGCEKLKDVTTTSVYVSKNGVVTEAIVEDYSKDDDYTEDELKVFVEDDIKKFTEERGDAVKGVKHVRVIVCEEPLEIVTEDPVLCVFGTAVIKGKNTVDTAGEWTTKSTESASASSSEQTKTEETEQEYEQDVLLASPVIVVYGK